MKIYYQRWQTVENARRTVVQAKNSWEIQGLTIHDKKWYRLKNLEGCKDRCFTENDDRGQRLISNVDAS